MQNDANGSWYALFWKGRGLVLREERLLGIEPVGAHLPSTLLTSSSIPICSRGSSRHSRIACFPTDPSALITSSPIRPPWHPSCHPDVGRRGSQDASPIAVPGRAHQTRVINARKWESGPAGRSIGWKHEHPSIATSSKALPASEERNDTIGSASSAFVIVHVE